MIDLAAWVARPRFDEYLIAANHDHDSARELYEWNTSVSAAFFELISHVEVVLRNAVDRILHPLEVTSSARINYRQGYWFASATFLDEHDLDFHRAAIRHLGKEANEVGRDKTLASLTFGMWVAIFGPSYEQLFRKHLVHAFPHRDAGFKRKTVHDRVLALRTLRNRIAHHQAIFDLPLEERFEQAMDLLHWIEPQVAHWVQQQCRVPELLDQRPTAAESITVVVPASEAWPFYLEQGAYICQPGRFFRQVSHVSFYANAAIQPEIAKILEHLDHVRWTPEEIGRRMSTGDPHDEHIARIIKESRTRGWDQDEYQLFLLTSPDSEGQAKGHLTLPGPVPQQRRGRGSAWVRRQRYVALNALKDASTVADLDQQ
jgi:hypothetical protein